MGKQWHIRPLRLIFHRPVQIVTNGGWILVCISLYFSPSSWLTVKGNRVRSAVTPPAASLVPNIHRKSNPFSPSGKADWVSPLHPAAKQRDMHVSNGGVLQNPLLPPRHETRNSSAQGSKLASESAVFSEVDGTGTAVRPFAKMSRNPKMPPPIPRKPVSLSSKRIIDGAPVSLSRLSESSAANLVQGYEDKFEMSHLPICSMNTNKGYGENVASSKDPDLLGFQCSKATLSHGGMLTKSTQNNSAKSNGDLLGDSDGDSIKWRSLLP